MLTPQEVQEKKFEKAMFGGYDMASIDDFLEKVTEDYTALYKENAVLKSKLKVLVNTVEEYRSVDEAMRKALLSAQKMAEEKVTEAKVYADDLIRKAQFEAGTLTQRLRDENENELRRQAMLHEQTVLFANRLTELYKEHIILIQSAPSMVFDSQKVFPEADVSKKTQDAAPPVRAANEPTIVMPNENPGHGTAAPVSVREIRFQDGDTTDDVSVEDDTVVPRPRLDFPDIQNQFGRHYSVNGSDRPQN
jgi:cell division initiation protein